MKKKATVLISLATAIVLFSATLGCTVPGETGAGSIPAGAPALQPTNHEGRFENNGASGCYGCHGYGSKANPNLTGATVLPEDHYVDGSYEAKEIDPNRLQCNTCHSVG